MAPVWS